MRRKGALDAARICGKGGRVLATIVEHADHFVVDRYDRGEVVRSVVLKRGAR